MLIQLNQENKFFSYNLHKKYKKYAQINSDKTLIETNYQNNKISFKQNDYSRYITDLKVIKDVKLR
ncbi:hypothetical protein ALNOE001_16770 [Candidatus Methanobinarius endosymbioticus]|uniref:Uncharacterized protein n=1 Tax=Candidatus Methanobinarius endosymbioticus TaxID=2006182 RepID=A0A366MA69_9EURY|nr:hypothetical protein ALNOE001_16770 [Candidatus Methanobinarius endosymbioticus]